MSDSLSINLGNMDCGSSDWYLTFQETKDKSMKVSDGCKKPGILGKMELGISRVSVISQAPEPLSQIDIIHNPSSGPTWLVTIQLEKEKETNEVMAQRKRRYTAILKGKHRCLSFGVKQMMIAYLQQAPGKWDGKVISNLEAERYRMNKDAANRKRLATIPENKRAVYSRDKHRK